MDPLLFTLSYFVAGLLIGNAIGAGVHLFSRSSAFDVDSFEPSKARRIAYSVMALVSGFLLFSLVKKDPSLDKNLGALFQGGLFPGVLFALIEERAFDLVERGLSRLKPRIGHLLARVSGRVDPSQGLRSWGSDVQHVNSLFKNLNSP